ncbi:RPE-retinal G protein-coupled receptor [Methylocaldum marinum]|uniref:RPE-retinal G protein-coupled receptor n=1 Tax=Methylocaldum marinum TaxID=1432792 RepID=A0A250KRQ4_9GAMM|nr:RPE-retinal G protein-coupled receptor [Methylocaldum marinum]
MQSLLELVVHEKLKLFRLTGRHGISLSHAENPPLRLPVNHVVTHLHLLHPESDDGQSLEGLLYLSVPCRAHGFDG